jgi:hypothetical protein
VRRKDKEPGCLVALAGRRVDSESTDPPRFPLTYVPLVRERLAELLQAENATAVVCSAACGADLTALEAAAELGLRRRIVLPFAPERFRITSVVDRPGDWGEVYDRVIADVDAKGDLVVIPPVAGDDSDAYQAANEAIIREAEDLSRPGERIAVIVWEGGPRPDADATEAFRKLAEDAGFSQRFVTTL